MAEDVMSDLLQLQYIELCQEVMNELEARGVTDVRAAEILIDICREVASQEEFLERVKNLNLPVKEQFVSNLYILIKKKLPREGAEPEPEQPIEP
jgi:hypothetical protein